MLKQRFVLAVFLIASVAAGCRASPPEPEGYADASGVICEILPAPALPTILELLVEHPGAAPPSDRSVVHVNRETAIFVRELDGRLRRGQTDDLQTGAYARIQIQDLELRSYPRQVFATRIEMIR